MNLTICVRCSHPANEHTAKGGCLDLLDLQPDGYPGVCDCHRTQVEVYRQHVPPVDEHAQRDSVAALLAAGDDLAGLLLMVLDNEIRCGWVAEGSPFLDEPRRALERWHVLVLEGVGGAEPMSADERDREVLEDVRRIYGLPPAANDWLAKARENLERAARFAEYSDPAAARRRIQAQRFIEEARKALIDDDAHDSC